MMHYYIWTVCWFVLFIHSQPIDASGRRDAKQNTSSRPPRSFGYRKEQQRSRRKAPNIIFIMTDDQDIELGSMNYMPKTLKILRDGGAQFPNAFVTTPMCCPSRSSMLTGMYVHNHNVYTNNDNCSSPMWKKTHESRSFATYLSNAGYRTGYFGKYLNEYNGDYIPPGYREWVGLIRNSRFYNYSVNMNGKKIKHGNNYELDYYPDLIANDSITFLRHSKQYFSNKPVMMVMSFPSPHGPEDSAPQYNKMFLNVTSHRTPSWNYAPNPDKQWLLRYTRKMEPIHIKFTDVLNTKRLQTLQSVDDAVERIYNELLALDELDNTYIFYTSDHGYHLGQFGLIKGKSMPFEFDIRVPFFVRGPNVPKGVRIPNIVLNIDIAPTFLDIAGINIPEHMDGKSVLKLLMHANQIKRSGRKLYNGEVKRRKAWRDTFLVERGKISLRQIKKFTKINEAKLTKEQKLDIECRKPEYSSPCQSFQKWECVSNGINWRIQKCRSWPVHQNYEDDCYCPPVRRLSQSQLDARINKMHRDERRMQRNFLKLYVNKGFQPRFIGSRSKREINELFLNDSIEDFDVDGILKINSLLDLTVPDMMHDNISSHILKKRSSPEISNADCDSTNDSDSCNKKKLSEDVWKLNKESINKEIKALRGRIDRLKGLRKQLREKRPIDPTFSQTDYEKNIASTTKTPCDCSKSYKMLRHNRRKLLREERRRMKIAKSKKKDKRVRKKKYDKYLCNAERMNCFAHDNNHWKTAPLWTYGPFCFCQNANNNTYWCLRTINDTHNFLYCEFITGFLCYYDLNTDPYELQNKIYNLEYSVLEQLRFQLNELRKCKGSQECTVRYRHPGTKSEGGVVGSENQKETKAERIVTTPSPQALTTLDSLSVESLTNAGSGDQYFELGSGEVELNSELGSGDASLDVVYQSDGVLSTNLQDEDLIPALMS